MGIGASKFITWLATFDEFIAGRISETDGNLRATILLKVSRKQKKVGQLVAKGKKIPYEEQLQFLRPNRVLRPTSGNFQAPSNTQQDADEEPRSETVRSDTPLESEAPGPSNPLEYFDQHLDVEEDVSNLSSDLPPSSTPTPAAGEIEEMEEATNIPSSQTTTRPPTARRARRSLRITDSQLEVESQALSFIRRVDNSDDSSYFGYEMASCCRKVPLDRQNHFKAYCHAVAKVFLSPQALPPLEDMIKKIAHHSWTQGPQPSTTCTQYLHTNRGFLCGYLQPPAFSVPFWGLPLPSSLSNTIP
ncbi:uncharacterized protein LOC130285279 [Hyla sarda]|uniref:uncharacterized protein LOC130285279 n=1 Tax=Hyla sarda TaxID=327740 RepID=UPI0024C3F4F5|nr:uncharacterized protein LOC130285279 [Hyla sarda]